MRAGILTVTLLLPLFAGCISPEPVVGASLQPDPAAIVLPAGATMETIEGGVRFVFDAVKMPFSEDITIPPGTTLVRLTAEPGVDLPMNLALRNAETGRRRCQPPVLEGWGAPILGTKSCEGLAVVDALPATWEAYVDGRLPESKRVSIELIGGPIPGPAAALDLRQLSMRTHAMLDTEVAKVASFDGTALHVEVTRPAVEGPVPAVIVSTPYSDATRKAGLRPEDDLIQDWGARGYAIVAADVRGYGESEGCVEVWGASEQKDQAALVDWVASQPWSDGNVGFYGQSYDGTTAVSAAVNAPAALKAIIAVAPVPNAYDDWHFGGVPNGESTGSPTAYQKLGGGLDPVPVGSRNPTAYLSFARGAPAFLQDLPYTAGRVDNGYCDPTLMARANDPRATYTSFYEERNMSARAKDVRAAVLYAQGFEDTNVKSSMITHWFNALEAPKLGLFGHWEHQHPVRADQELLFLAWMDQHLRGKPVGVDRLPVAQVVDNTGALRVGDAWPPPALREERLFLDLGKRALSPAPADGYATLQLIPEGEDDVPLPVKPTFLRFEGILAEETRLVGSGSVEVDAHVEYGENGYIAAFLYDGERQVTWGMFNLAHRDGHDKHVSSSPGQMIRFLIPLLPTEHVFAAGSEVSLVLRGANVGDWSLVRPTQPMELGLHGGEEGTALVLPTLSAP